MTDIEFIEKVREIIQIPKIVPDEIFLNGFKSNDIKFIGKITDHVWLISNLFEEYDDEKAGIN